MNSKQKRGKSQENIQKQSDYNIVDLVHKLSGRSDYCELRNDSDAEKLDLIKIIIE